MIDLRLAIWRTRDATSRAINVDGHPEGATAVAEPEVSGELAKAVVPVHRHI